MKFKDAKDNSNGIYNAFKNEVCEECNIKIKENLSKMSKIQLALLMTRPTMIHKKLGICQDCINKIHKKLLKQQRK